MDNISEAEHQSSAFIGAGPNKLSVSDQCPGKKGGRLPKRGGYKREWPRSAGFSNAITESRRRLTPKHELRSKEIKGATPRSAAGERLAGAYEEISCGVSNEIVVPFRAAKINVRSILEAYFQVP